MAKIIYRIIVFLTACSAGLLLAPGLIQLLKLPHSLTVKFILAIVLAALCTMAFHVLSERYQTIREETENYPSDQGWAWLKPAGIAIKSPFPVNKAQVIIGREIACDIMLCDDSISRRHAEVIRDSDCWRVHDLGSSNGTFVNGKRIEEVELADGDVITLGDINLTFEAPRVIINSDNPEPVSNIQITPESLGIETQVHTSSTMPLQSPTERWNAPTEQNPRRP